MQHLAILFILVIGLSVQQRQVQIGIPEWISGGGCVTSGGKVAATVVKSELITTCPLPGTSVECTLNGAEPFDTSTDALCKVPKLQPSRAQRVSLRLDQPVRVQWLETATDGRVSVLAERVIAPADSSLFVTPSESRFLRFIQSGAAPYTLSSTRMSRDAAWELPKPAPGGELFIWMQPGRVRPTMFRLKGPTTSEMAAEEGYVSATGLRDGRYSVTPIYSGNVPASPLSVTVRPNESSDLVLPLQDVGAVMVTANAYICADSARLTVFRVTTGKIGLTQTTSRSRVASVDPQGQCDRVFAGLSPGAYEASLEGKAGVLATREFTIASQVNSNVVFDSLPVVLAGTVTLNGQPIAHTAVTANPTGNPMPRGVTTETDDRGRYELKLHSTGAVRLSLRSKIIELLGQRLDVDVKEGYNTVDWRLVGGTVQVTILNADKDVPIGLTLRWEAKGEAAGNTIDLAGSVESPFEINGLAFGNYTIMAAQRSTRGEPPRVSESVEFALAEGKTRFVAKLELSENRAIIRFVDSVGQPAPGVTITGYMVSRVQEVEPGAFSMSGVAAGTPLLIRAPGFVPICRLAPKIDTRVELDRGRPIEMHFSGVPVKRPVGSLVWRDNCPVALSEFSSTPANPREHATSAFLMQRFPSIDEIVYYPPAGFGSLQRVSIMGGVVFVDIAKR